MPRLRLAEERKSQFCIMNKRQRNILIAFGIPTIYAIALRLLFGIKDWYGIFSVMSFTFLFFLPSIIGALTVYLSEKNKVEKISYRIFAPWIPIFLFLIITLVFAIEGWACWLMILPIFLIAASVGGLIGGYLKLKKKNDRINVSIIVLLPIFISPVEQLIEKIPATYNAYTNIDINSTADKIWDNITRVKTINKVDDTGYLTAFLGFPRPLRAELKLQRSWCLQRSYFYQWTNF